MSDEGKKKKKGGGRGCSAFSSDFSEGCMFIYMYMYVYEYL